MLCGRWTRSICPYFVNTPMSGNALFTRYGLWNVKEDLYQGRHFQLRKQPCMGSGSRVMNCLSVYLSIYLSINPSIYLSIHLFIYLSTIYLSIHLSIYRFTAFCWTLAAFSVVGRTAWTGDQPVARPLPTHRPAQTQNKHTQKSMPSVGF
jgi:hypothetical protein